MDCKRIGGNGKRFKCGGKLTNDDLDVVNGRYDPREGKIQQRYSG